MTTLLESPVAQRLAWTLLHFLWQGALLGTAAWGTLALLRRSAPQLRYLVGCVFLVGCLASASLTFAVLTPTGASLPLAAEASPRPSRTAARTGPDAPVNATPLDMADAWRTRLQPALPWVLALWLAGVLLLGLRTAGGWLWLRRLKASARPVVEPAWLAALVAGAGLRRKVRFLESVRVTTPMCLGLLRPVVLLPLGFFAGLDPLAAEAVLAHELAHIRRLDVLVNGGQCLLEVVFFFHPAVWWISSRIRTEREHCCDDAAVLACGDAVLYAETLSRLDDCPDRPLAPALLARGGNLMERLQRILLAEPPRLRFSPPGLLLVAAIVLVVALPVRAAKALAAAKAAASARVPDGPSLPVRPEGPPTTVVAIPSVLTGPVRIPVSTPRPAIVREPLLPQAPTPQAPGPGRHPTDPSARPQVPDTQSPQGTEALQLLTPQGLGAVYLPVDEPVVRDVIALQRSHQYAVRVPPGASVRVQALSARGNAYLRLKPLPDQRGVSGLWPGSPVAICRNGSHTEQVFLFSVYFDPNYSGPRDVLIQQAFATLPAHP